MSPFADKIGEHYGEIEYRGGTVLRRRRRSGGNVRLSLLLISFLLSSRVFPNLQFYTNCHNGAVLI